MATPSVLKISMPLLLFLCFQEKTVWGACMPSFDKIHPELTSTVEFSTFNGKSHDFAWDDP